MLQNDENQPLSESATRVPESPKESAGTAAVRRRRSWIENPRVSAIGRFALFLILVRVLLTPLLFAAIRPFRFKAEATLDYLAEALVLIAVLLGTLIMAGIEHRSFFDYGLRNHRATQDLFKGAIVGYLALSLMLLGLQATHHSHFGPEYPHGTALLRAALLNVVVFALTAVYEELAFRGYPLYTLTEGIGFWPAAAAMSLFFAWEHTLNPGESRVGIAAVFVFGLVLAFSVWRSGSLLWALGFHFMWDYSETFIYGVPDSGLVSPAHLLSTRFTGPAWITGGSVGPEGSYFIFLVLGAIAVVIHLMYPSPQFQKS